MHGFKKISSIYTGGLNIYSDEVQFVPVYFLRNRLDLPEKTKRKASMPDGNMRYGHHLLEKIRGKYQCLLEIDYF